MSERKILPLIKKTQVKAWSQKPVGSDSSGDIATMTHVGTSDAFLQTENTLSPDADNISDEKLDEMMDRS